MNLQPLGEGVIGLALLLHQLVRLPIDEHPQAQSTGRTYVAQYGLRTKLKNLPHLVRLRALRRIANSHGNQQGLNSLRL
jgi:hypothetical protein